MARFGGEEFAIILPATTAAGALETAERLRKGVLERGIAHQGSVLEVVTVSVGCATIVPQPSASPTELIGAADAALYAAKKGGRNRVEAAVAGSGQG